MVGASSGKPDLESLRTTIEESRRVHDHQISLLNDIDNKAIQTVRLSIVLIALIVSVAQIMGPKEAASVHILVKSSVGMALFLLTLVVLIGIGIYDTSDVLLGIGQGHREELLRHDYDERDWLVVLLSEYNSWTADTREIIENNSSWLSRIQVLLVIAIGYLFASAIPIFTSLSAPIAFSIMSVVGAIGLIVTYAIGRYIDND